MYKVIIAEDEMLVRLGLKNSVKWENLNMSVVGDAGDGQKAWELYQETQPDLIITDLKMPGMDGMELIRKVREIDSETKFIILTCMEEFSLARDAMSLGVSDYVLKLTMSQDELHAVLNKVKNELNRSKVWMKDPMYDAHNEQQYKDKLLKDYLFYNSYSPEEFKQRMKTLNLRLSSKRLIVSVMKINQYNRLEAKFEDYNGQLIQLSLLNILSELLRRYRRGEVFHDKQAKQYILLLSFEDVTSEDEMQTILHEIMAHIHKAMKSYLNVSVSFGISGAENNYASLKRQYHDACKELKKAFFAPEDLYIYSSKHSFRTFLPDINKQLHRITIQYAAMFDHSSDTIKSEMASILKEPEWDEEQMKRLFTNWLHLPLTHFRDSGESISTAVLFGKKIAVAESIYICIDEYIAYLEELTKEVGKRNRFSRLSREVAAAIGYIEQNYDLDVTLNDIASHVNMSANYLTSLFKNEMNFSCIEYLIHFRIEKAKEYLTQSSLKTYEIAHKVGFTDLSYFSRTFKKYTGLSPRMYRQQWNTQSCE